MLAATIPVYNPVFYHQLAQQKHRDKPTRLLTTEEIVSKSQ